MITYNITKHSAISLLQPQHTWNQFISPFIKTMMLNSICVIIAFSIIHIPNQLPTLYLIVFISIILLTLITTTFIIATYNEVKYIKYHFKYSSKTTLLSKNNDFHTLHNKLL